jgi:hypothetical protein
MSVGTWTRLSAVLVRSLNRRPQSRHRKRRKPCTVRPSRSVVDDEWQCGQSMTALLIAQNGPGNLSAGGALGKLPRDLTEPRLRAFRLKGTRCAECGFQGHYFLEFGTKQKGLSGLRLLG